MYMDLVRKRNEQAFQWYQTQCRWQQRHDWPNKFMCILHIVPFKSSVSFKCWMKLKKLPNALKKKNLLRFSLFLFWLVQNKIIPIRIKFLLLLCLLGFFWHIILTWTLIRGIIHTVCRQDIVMPMEWAEVLWNNWLKLQQLLACILS